MLKTGRIKSQGKFSSSIAICAFTGQIVSLSAHPLSLSALRVLCNAIYTYRFDLLTLTTKQTTRAPPVYCTTMDARTSLMLVLHTSALF